MYTTEYYSAIFVDFVVQSLSHVQLFVIPWIAAHQASLSFTISQSVLKVMSVESVMPFDSVWHSLGPSMLLQMALFHSFYT